MPGPPLSIRFAVGAGTSPNKDDDVAKIITLLREIDDWAGGAPDADRTNFKAAILTFQRYWRLGGGDGIVSPGIERPRTLRMLNVRAGRIAEPEKGTAYPETASVTVRFQVPPSAQYSQGDKRWKEQTLNDSKDIIWAKGCALTACATMIAARNIRFQEPHLATVKSVLASKNPSYALDPTIVTPATLEAWMSYGSQGYANRSKGRSDLDFGYLTGGFGKRVWLYSQYKGSATSFAEISGWLKSGLGVVAHVSNEGTMNHWVVLTGHDDTGIFSVMDRSCELQFVYFSQLDRFNRYHFS